VDDGPRGLDRELDNGIAEPLILWKLGKSPEPHISLSGDAVDKVVPMAVCMLADHKIRES